MRTSNKYRLAASVSVSGSQREPSAVRNQPLKSIDHSSFGAVAGEITSPCAIARRRRARPRTRPSRFRMSPIVEAAGHSTFGASSSQPRLDLLRAEMRKSPPHGNDTLGDPIRGRVWAARGGMAQVLKPACLSAFTTPLPNVERLTADAVPPAQLANRENARLVVTKQRDTLFHRTGLLERHRPISSNRATTLTCQESTRAKLSGLSPVCTYRRQP